MLAASFKRTKIVATIGPATSSSESLHQLMLAGVNGFRLNFSHGSHAEHGAVLRSVRKLSDELERPASVIIDLAGPKIRVGTLPSDGLPIVRGNIVRFQFGVVYEETGVIPVQHDVSRYLRTGERIFLRDGQIEVEVTKLQKQLITCRVLAPGLLFSNQGMNLPDTDLGGDILTEKDQTDLEFAIDNNADYVAISFVQTAADVKRVRTILTKRGSGARIITKLETRAGVENLEGIVLASDGIMVARGDLAVETLPEAVPAVQRRIIELAKQHRKIVIVATQMLESMIQSQQPTRAEVSDVATAVLEGADAVMLSGETAMGLFPVEAVKMMKRVILYTEREEAAEIRRETDVMYEDQANAISAAAVVLAHKLPAKVIIAETSTGQTARNVAALRPKMPIIMVTDHKQVYNQLAILWGGKSYFHRPPQKAVEVVMTKLLEAGNVKRGHLLVVASGHQPGVAGGTDSVSIHVVS